MATWFISSSPVRDRVLAGDIALCFSQGRVVRKPVIANPSLKVNLKKTEDQTIQTGNLTRRKVKN